MVTIALFNNKGGVGKTTLVYHLSYMFSRIGYPTVAVDLDPQANLTSAFFDEDDLERLWNGSDQTIMACISPILEGTGDISAPKLLRIADSLSLVAGDLGLSRFEDKLSESWPKSYNNDAAALRATSAFHRLIDQAGKLAEAALAIIDVGPNLGAINRAALLSADFLVIPLAADLFSLQGLKNLGPAVRSWREQWAQVLTLVSARTSVDLPRGQMQPCGYVLLQHAVRLDRPARAYGRWAKRIPSVYREAVLNELPPVFDEDEVDPNCLAMLRNYRSLMPMAQDARKPIFDLRAADGAIGSHAQLVQMCGDEFERLARAIAEKCAL